MFVLVNKDPKHGENWGLKAQENYSTGSQNQYIAFLEHGLKPQRRGVQEKKYEAYIYTMNVSERSTTKYMGI